MDSFLLRAFAGGLASELAGKITQAGLIVDRVEDHFVYLRSGGSTLDAAVHNAQVALRDCHGTDFGLILTRPPPAPVHMP